MIVWVAEAGEGQVKQVTLETLQQALEDAQSGLAWDTSDAQYARLIYDALPTPPDAVVVVPQVDPEVAAFAELMALERAGKLARWNRTHHWFAQIKVWQQWLIADTASELLAAVRKALKEATDETDVSLRQVRAVPGVSGPPMGMSDLYQGQDSPRSTTLKELR